MAGIAATITAGGLKCTAIHDDAQYPRGTGVSDERMKHLQDCDLDRDLFHGEWNYTIRAAPRDAPEPEPEPERPGRIPAAVLNCPALTGMAPEDVTALAAALEVPFGARREQRNYSHRGRARVNAVRNGGGPSANSRLALADYVLAVRLRDHLNLPMEAIAVLLGVERSTIGHAITLARSLIAGSGILVPPAAPPPAVIPRTPAELREHAATAGITLTIPQNGETMPKHFRTRRRKPRHAGS